jgi:hypothetical protein
MENILYLWKDSKVQNDVKHITGMGLGNINSMGDTDGVLLES